MKLVFFYYSRISESNEIFETELVNEKGLDDLMTMIDQAGKLIKWWEVK